MANRENFGAPSQGNGNQYKMFKLVPGSNRYRIGPAFKSLAASGKWFVYTKQHFGYRGMPTEQNTKGPMRVFLCPQDIDRKTEMVRVPCAQCDKRDEVEGMVEVRTVKLESEGKTRDQIDTILGVQKEWLKTYNLDKKYNVLAMNEKREWGVLPLPYKAKEALDNRRKKVQTEEGYDILSINDGAWVDFVREGEGIKTIYTCEVVQEVVIENGKKFRVNKQEALTDADLDAIEATCPDLSTIGRVLTSEQIERLVESGGDPEVVDNVFNEGRKTEGSSSKASRQPAKESTDPVTPLSKDDVEASPDTITPLDNPKLSELEVLRARLAELEASHKTSASAAEITVRLDDVPDAKQAQDNSPAPSAAELEKLPDSEFMKVLRPKKR